MKTQTLNAIAVDYGVDVKTLRQWLLNFPHIKVNPKMRILPPKIIGEIYQALGDPKKPKPNIDIKKIIESEEFKNAIKEALSQKQPLLVQTQFPTFSTADPEQTSDQPLFVQTQFPTFSTADEPSPDPDPTRNILDRNIVRILLEFGLWKIDDETTVVQFVLKELDGFDIESAQLKPIYELIKSEFASGKVHPESFYIGCRDERINRVAVDVLAESPWPYLISNNWVDKYKIVLPTKRDIFINDINSSLLHFKKFINSSELKKIEEKLKDESDNAEILRLMKLHKLLIGQKKFLAMEAGAKLYAPKINLTEIDTRIKAFEKIIADPETSNTLKGATETMKKEMKKMPLQQIYFPGVRKPEQSPQEKLNISIKVFPALKLKLATEATKAGVTLSSYCETILTKYLILK